MKRKTLVAVCLIMGSMMMSCEDVEDLSRLAECANVLTKMTEIQTRLDNPNLTEEEKTELYSEYRRLEGWGNKNCGE